MKNGVLHQFLISIGHHILLIYKFNYLIFFELSLCIGFFYFISTEVVEPNKNHELAITCLKDSSRLFVIGFTNFSLFFIPMTWVSISRMNQSLLISFLTISQPCKNLYFLNNIQIYWSCNQLFGFQLWIFSSYVKWLEKISKIW